MNFFEHQEQAQRKSVRLVIYYFFGVFLTFLAIHFLVAGITASLSETQNGDSQYSRSFQSDPAGATLDTALNPELILIDLLAVALVVGGGTLFKVSELKRLDGDGIARSFGGTRIAPLSANRKEKRLLNIVEEMAIASGIPVPAVYVLRNEPTINAFAAGFTGPTSVVAVTQGALDYLTRDELQGVVAHEFSHILHQDTRLNMKLIGVLFGLEMIALIGLIIMRAAPRMIYVTSSRNRDKNDNALAVMAAILLVGFLVLIIGLVGQLFANIIRAAISRQREFLADASAVQYTRNPDGIAGALKKIGGSVGSHISNNNAVEASHLFFSNIFGRGFFSGLFNSHPDLTVRIRRIDPQFQGDYPKQVQKTSDDAFDASSPGRPSSSDRFRELLNKTTGGAARTISVGSGAAAAAAPAAGAALAAALLSSAGEVSQKKLRIAEDLMTAIPDEVAASIWDPDGAMSSVLAVLLSGHAETRERQLAGLREQTRPEIFIRTKAAADRLAEVPLAVRIPIVQKAFPLLRSVSKEEYLSFRETALALIKSDGQVDLFEFTVFGFVFNDLDTYFRLKAPLPEKFDKPGQIAEPFRQVASHLAYAGSGEPGECRRAYSLAAGEMGLPSEILPKEDCSNTSFSAALRELSQTKPILREKMLKAFYACVTADGFINTEEGELIRAVSAYFRCPMPAWDENSDFTP